MDILLVAGPGISLKEPYNSGIEAFIVSFADQLINNGHNVDVIAHEAEIDCKFNVINPFGRFSSDQSSYFQCLKEKRQFEELDFDSYDVIHYNMFYPHLIETGLKFKKTSFLTLHSPTDKERIESYKKFSRQSNLKFVAISARIKKQWDCALNIDIPLIHNGIDLNNWPLPTVRNPEYLLWSARITEEKNVSAAIRLAQNINIPLKIAGRIVDQQYFDKEVKPHLNTQIQYVGHVNQRELNSLAQKAYAYLATATWQEPFGLAALEMLASGLPVVGFNTAVPQDWENESVLTTASLRWQDLVELVERSRTVSQYACRNFASNMTIQKMTSDYVILYEEVLSNKYFIEKRLSEDNENLELIVDQRNSSN